MQISTQATIIEETKPSARDNFMHTLADPNIAYMLLALGFLALLFEITTPGFGVSGITGTICLILSFYSLSILPTNYAGAALLILGLIFFIAEALTPTFGMFTIGGIIAFFFGSIMLFNQPEFIRVSFSLIIPFVIALAILSFFLMGNVLLALRQKPKTGNEAMVGKDARAITDINLEGKVTLRGEIWTAQANEKINKNEKVIIEKINGLILLVRKK
jgi:membrane-bound serine protease (ClpP class)